MNQWKPGFLFCIGGGTYVGLELMYRGRSHISMFAAGGLSFLLLGRVSRQKQALPVRALMGMLTITAVELGTGLLVNRDYMVWDYRNRPYNVLGQVCPQFMLLWIPLSLAGMGLYKGLDRLWDTMTA